MRTKDILQSQPLDRVAQLISQYGHGEQSVAWHLCDKHDPASTVYQIIGPDFSVVHLTYGELKAESERLAAAFRNIGLSAGDRIATLMGKSRAYLVTLMAIWRIGAVHLPLFTAFAPAAISYRLGRANARLVICDDNQFEKLRPGPDMPENPTWTIVTLGENAADALHFQDLMAANVPEPYAAMLAPDRPFIHIFTSGTTGKPKGLVVPVSALAAIQSYMELALDLRADDVYWNGADPGWAYGLYYGVVGSLLVGARSILVEGGFAAETTLKVLSDFAVTNFAAAPTVYRGLRAAEVREHRIFTLRCASSAGEPLTPDVNEWALHHLGVAVHDHYGQTETGMLINNHHHRALQGALKPGSMGRSMPGWEAVILREKDDELALPEEMGRVAIALSKSPLAWFCGYVDEPDRTQERYSADGAFYLTGDTGRIDKDGDFFFSARDDDVILMAGYRIGPGEIENIICMHQSVSDCGVTAVPDAIRGEVMEAFVVLREGFAPDASMAKDIQQWVKARYAAHAYPRTVHFVNSLPKTPSGKLQRNVLRQNRLAELAAGGV